MKNLFTTIRIFFIYAVILGLIYPLLIMVIGQKLFPYQANGSLITNKKNQEIIGSELIAQEFTAAKYFHGRFSAINYDAKTSGGSNLAPSNKKLIDLARNHLEQIQKTNNLSQIHNLPADMALNSASGLDPNITPKNAFKQLERVATARNISEDVLKKLIKKHTTNDFVGIWGKKQKVNVLKLNLELDKNKL